MKILCLFLSMDAGLVIDNRLIYPLKIAKTQNDLEVRTRYFALRIVDLVERLPKSRSGDAVAGQLIKSGTSIGANYR
jgi:hypothetical protein